MRTLLEHRGISNFVSSSSGPCLKSGTALALPVWIGAILLQKTAFPQMNLQKDIGDCVQHESNLIRICGACIVRIDLLRCRALVEADKALEEILASCVVVSPASVVREVVAQG